MYILDPPDFVGVSYLQTTHNKFMNDTKLFYFFDKEAGIHNHAVTEIIEIPSVCKSLG